MGTVEDEGPASSEGGDKGDAETTDTDEEKEKLEPQTQPEESETVSVKPNGYTSSKDGVSANLDILSIEQDILGSGEMASLLNLAHWREDWNPRMSMSFTSTKGLLNAPGENNCFLNSAVQVLWHLDVFRRSFRTLSGHACMGNSCIFCALKVIFTQFQYSDQTALPPDALRKALAKTFVDQQRFQLGHMDDAAECFENILMRIHFHIAHGESEDMCNAKHCIPHQKFAMTVVEQVVCRCGATSEPHPFTQMVYYVSTSALSHHYQQTQERDRGRYYPALDFSQLLKEAVSDGDIRPCPSDCGEKVKIRRNLMNRPDVVSVGLVWDSDRPSQEHIRDVLRSIGLKLELHKLFHSVVDLVAAQKHALELVGLVCYYGKHYSTFYFHSKRCTWIYFDDANVKEIGDRWESVVDKCCRGHFQPLLLMYANPDSTPVAVETAPQYTFILETSPDVNVGRHQQQVDSRVPDKASETAGPPSYPKCISQGRAQTPNPSMYDGTAPCESRRSQTPTPGWGGYHSEEEEDKKDCVHVRQSSFLNAMDMTDSSHSRQPNYLSHTIRQGELLDLNAQVPPPQYQPHYYGTPTFPPPPAEPEPTYTQAGQTGHQSHYQGALVGDSQQGQGLNNNSSAPNGTEYGDWTLSSSNPYRRQVSVPQSSESPSLNGWQMVSPPTDAPPSPGDFKKGKGQVHADVVRYQQRGQGMNGPYQQLDQQGGSRQLSYSQHMNNYPVPDGMKTPGLRRSQSLESTQFSMAGQGLDDWEYVQPLQNNTTKHRPSSVTPFDFANQRPQVTQRHPQQGCRDADSIDGMSSDSASLSSQDMMEKSDYDMYINRKAVESILSHQHKLARQMSNCSAKSTGSNSSTESGKALSHKQKRLLKDALKADITDNSSVSSQNSHRDSGYRSSESSGDRTSNSSAGSGSTESQAGDGMTSGYPRPEQIKMLFGVQSWDQRMQGSASGAHNTANMSSRGSHKLTQIPETLPAGHRGPVYKETISEKPTIQLKPSVAPDVPPPENKHADGLDKTCAALFQAAEELMLQCKQQEEKQDNASALCLCNKALNYYQQALNIQSTSQKTYIFARMRHNACVMKSRSLHRNMMTRQDSCQSNMSSDTNDDGQMSTSSKGTDSGRGSEKDFMTQQDIMSVYHSQSYGPVAPASVMSYSSSSSSSSSKDNVKYRGTKQQKSAGGACARKLRKHSGNNGMQSAQSATDIRNIHQTPEISEKYDPGNLVVHYATLPRKQKQKAAKMVSGGGSVTATEVKTYHRTRPKSPVADKPSSRSHKDRCAKNEASSSGVSSASSSSSISHPLGQSDIRPVLYPEVSNKPANHALIQRAGSVTSQVSSLSQHVSNISLSQRSWAEHSYLGPQPTDRKEPHYHCPYEMGLRKQQPPQPPQLPAQHLTSTSYQPPSGNTDSSYACHNPIYDYLPWQTKQGQGNHSRQNSSDSNRTLTPCFGEHSRQTSTASSTTVMGDTDHSRENSSAFDSRPFEEESVSNSVRSAPTSPHPGRRVIGPPRPGNRQSNGPVRPSLVKRLDQLQQQQVEMLDSQDQAALQHALQPAPKKGILKNANSHKGEDPGVMTQGIAQGGSGDHDHHNHMKSHEGYREMTTENTAHTNPAAQAYGSSTAQHHSNPAHTDRNVSNPATPHTANKNHSRVSQVAALFDQRFQTAGSQCVDEHSCSSHTAYTKKISETGAVEQQFSPACADQDAWADSELPRHFRPRTASDPTGCGRKPALVKKRAKHRQPKNVSFSENIALISTAEDTPEDPSFVRMIQNSLLTQSLPCNNNRPLPNKNAESDPSGRTSSSQSQGHGYESDGDEEESLDDSPSSPEEDFTDSSKVRCSLCRKHSVCANQVYCTDCNAYMSRFQPKVQ